MAPKARSGAGPTAKGQSTLLQFFAPKPTGTAGAVKARRTSPPPTCTSEHADGRDGSATRAEALERVDWPSVGGEIISDEEAPGNALPDARDCATASERHSHVEAPPSSSRSSDDDDTLADLLGLEEPRAVDQSAGHVDSGASDSVLVGGACASPAHQAGQTTSAAGTISSATAKLSQTFLDFGQSSLAVGTTCPRCGMLYAALEEDVAVHKRVCTALAGRRAAATQGLSESTVRATSRLTASLDAVPRKRPRGRGTSSERTGGSSLSAASAAGSGSTQLLLSSVAVDLLELLSGESKQRAGQRTARRTSGELKSRRASVALCECLPSPAPGQLAVYALDCTRPEVASSAAALRLLEALGFLGGLDVTMGYKVVFLTEVSSRRVVVAVAGRGNTREQDPELVFVTRPDGSQVCCTQRRFSLCDVNLLWRVPSASLVTALEHADSSEGTGVVGTVDRLRRLFIDKTTRACEHTALTAHAMQLRADAVGTALTAVAQNVVYGQSFDIATQCSYARHVLVKDDDSEEDGMWGVSREELCEVLRTRVGDADVDCFVHDEEDEGRGDVDCRRHSPCAPDAVDRVLGVVEYT